MIATARLTGAGAEATDPAKDHMGARIGAGGATAPARPAQSAAAAGALTTRVRPEVPRGERLVSRFLRATNGDLTS